MVIVLWSLVVLVGLGLLRNTLINKTNNEALAYERLYVFCKDNDIPFDSRTADDCCQKGRPDDYVRQWDRKIGRGTNGDR